MLRTFMTLLVVVGASACTAGLWDNNTDDFLVEGDGGAPAEVRDFTLLDVNTTSASFDSPVSPRDFIGRISVWYFGHAT